MSARIPIIICGATQKVATMVKSNMLPEYDGTSSFPPRNHILTSPVVYAGYNLAATANEVPQILSRSTPPSTSLHTQVGSNDFQIFPRAVIIGGGYSEEAFQTLFRACADACGSEAALPVPFFRVDNSITKRLAAEGKGPAPPSPEYSRAIAERLKERLREVGVGEERTGNRGKQFFF